MQFPPYPSFAAQAKAALTDRASLRLAVSGADSGWQLLMQSGVLVGCTTGIPLLPLLQNELELPAGLLARIDVLLLNGKPVDTPETALVATGARLALAAGLPGIAGLAMKSNSAVKGLRPGITHHHQDDDAPDPAPGHVELALFSLALPLLAERLLLAGVCLPAGKLARYLRPALKGICLLDEKEHDLASLRARLESAGEAMVALVVSPN